MNNIFLILVTIVFWALGSVFYKLAGQHTHPIITATILSILYVTLIPFAYKIFNITFQITLSGFIYSVLGGIGMCVGTLAYMFALRNGNVGSVTAASAVYPALTMLIAVLFLGEQIGFKQIVGCILAVISVILLSF